MTLLKEDKEVTMVDNINFSPEFLIKWEMWVKKMKPVKPEVKKSLELSIERGNKLLKQKI